MTTQTCTRCGAQVFPDAAGTLVDNTGGDVCGWNGGNEPHEVETDLDEIVELAILDVTGVVEGVPGMPDFL